MLAAGCYRVVDLDLPEVVGARSLFLRTDSGLVAGDARDPEISVIATEHPTEVLYSDLPLEALQVGPGLIAAEGEREIPPIGAFTWSEGVWQEDPNAQLRLPAFDPTSCLELAGGCLEGVPSEAPTGGEFCALPQAGWCRSPCEVPAVLRVELPESVPDAATATAAAACPPGQYAFVAGEPCRPLLGGCDADPPEGAAVVQEGAVGGNGTPSLPFGTVREAVDAAAATIYLRNGMYVLPPELNDVELVGECPGQTKLYGSTRLVSGRFERLTVLDSLEIERSRLIGVELHDDLTIRGGPVDLSEVVMDGAVLSVTGDSDVEAVGFIASGATGHSCEGSNVQFENARFEAVERAGALLTVGSQCVLAVKSGVLRGGAIGVLLQGGQGVFERVKLTEQRLGIYQEGGVLTSVDTLLAVSEIGVSAASGMIGLIRLVVNGGETGIEIRGTTAADVAMARFDGVKTAVRAQESARLQAHDVKVVGAGGGTEPAFLLDGREAHLLERISLSGAGPMNLLAATHVRELSIENPLRAAVEISAMVDLEGASVRAGPKGVPAVRIAAGGSAMLNDLRLLEGGCGIEVEAGAEVSVTGFSIEGFDTGLVVEDEGCAFLTDGTFRENIVAADLPAGHPLPWGVRFTGNLRLDP